MSEGFKRTALSPAKIPKFIFNPNFFPTGRGCSASLGIILMEYLNVPVPRHLLAWKPVPPLRQSTGGRRPPRSLARRRPRQRTAAARHRPALTTAESTKPRDTASSSNWRLLEPPLDLLARVPNEFLLRQVQFGTLADAAAVTTPTFIKPADPLHKIFDTGLYRSLGHLLNDREIDLQTPVLMSEVVEWTNEYRCFVCEGHAVAWSPYLSFGHPIWKPGCAVGLPPNLDPFIQRLHAAMPGQLPPAYVVDIGILADGSWAIVEFNPAWCSGLLGANVAQALRAIQRSARWVRELVPEERRWLRPSNLLAPTNG